MHPTRLDGIFDVAGKISGRIFFCQAVESMGKSLDQAVVIDAAATSAALQELKTRALDGYDVFALQNAIASGVINILTDDGDFCVVPGIVLFTANRTVLGVARAHAKLVTR